MNRITSDTRVSHGFIAGLFVLLSVVAAALIAGAIVSRVVTEDIHRLGRQTAKTLRRNADFAMLTDDKTVLKPLTEVTLHDAGQEVVGIVIRNAKDATLAETWRPGRSGYKIPAQSKRNEDRSGVSDKGAPVTFVSESIVVTSNLDSQDQEPAKASKPNEEEWIGSVDVAITLQRSRAAQWKLTLQLSVVAVLLASLSAAIVSRISSPGRRAESQP